MADNYLEKRMDEYRNGGTGNTIRKHKMPKKKTILVIGVTCNAHIDILKSLCNGGHTVFYSNVDTTLADDCKRTLARQVDQSIIDFDVIINNTGDEIPYTNSRLILSRHVSEENNMPKNTDISKFSSVNTIVYPDKNNGGNAARVIRFLTDADTDIMNNQRIVVL